VRAISTKEDLLTDNNCIDHTIVEISIFDQAGRSNFNILKLALVTLGLHKVYITVITG
jgi:hypothetical protein